MANKLLATQSPGSAPVQAGCYFNTPVQPLRINASGWTEVVTPAGVIQFLLRSQNPFWISSTSESGSTGYPVDPDSDFAVSWMEPGKNKCYLKGSVDNQAVYIYNDMANLEA